MHYQQDGFDMIRQRFITGSLGETGEENEEDVTGDFEDLEGNNSEQSMNNDELNIEKDTLSKKKEQLKMKFDAQYDGESDEEHAMNHYEIAKDAMTQQSEMNRKEFIEDDPELRTAIEGVGAGNYVRIIINDVSCEFVDNFDASYPIILGGILVNEEGFGFLQVSKFYYL